MKINRYILLIAALGIMVSCGKDDNRNGGDNNGGKKIKSSDIANATALYMIDANIRRSATRAEEDTDVMFKIDNEGKVSTITFTDEEGDVMDVTPTFFCNLSDDLIFISFESWNLNKQLSDKYYVARKSDGAVFVLPNKLPNSEYTDFGSIFGHYSPREVYDKAIYFYTNKNNSVEYSEKEIFKMFSDANGNVIIESVTKHIPAFVWSREGDPFYDYLPRIFRIDPEGNMLYKGYNKTYRTSTGEQLVTEGPDKLSDYFTLKWDKSAGFYYFTFTYSHPGYEDNVTTSQLKKMVPGTSDDKPVITNVGSEIPGGTYRELDFINIFYFDNKAVCTDFYTGVVLDQTGQVKSYNITRLHNYVFNEDCIWGNYAYSLRRYSGDYSGGNFIGRVNLDTGEAEEIFTNSKYKFSDIASVKDGIITLQAFNHESGEYCICEYNNGVITEIESTQSKSEIIYMLRLN